MRQVFLVLVFLIASASVAIASSEFDDVYLRGRAELHTGNDDRGIVLLREAAAGGHATAQEHLDYLYGTGAYIPRDPDEFVSWLQEKATEGDPFAQYRLGLSFVSDKRNGRDRKRGLGLISDAARCGLPYAQYELARLYDKGHGNLNDPIVAAHWYGRAADAGHVAAQYEYGRALLKGEGIGRDHANAYVYLSLAALQGHQEAAKRAKKVARRLSPETVLAAENATDAWTSRRAVQAIEVESGVYLSGLGGVSKPQIEYKTPIPVGRMIPFYVALDLWIDDAGSIVETRLINASDPTVGRNVMVWMSGQGAEPAEYLGNPVPSIRRMLLYRAAGVSYHQFGGYGSLPGGQWGQGPGSMREAQRLYRSRAGDNSVR